MQFWTPSVGPWPPRSFPSLKPKSQGGRAAFIASGPKAPIPPMDQTSLRPKVYRSRKHLEKLGALLRKGALPKPEIRLFALEEAVEAIKKAGKGEAEATDAAISVLMMRTYLETQGKFAASDGTKLFMFPSTGAVQEFIRTFK